MNPAAAPRRPTPAFLLAHEPNEKKQRGSFIRTTLFGAMRAIGAADASLVSTVEPVLTVALSAAVLGERLGPAQALGGSLILAAVLGACDGDLPLGALIEAVAGLLDVDAAALAGDR